MKASCPICHKKVEWEGNAFRPFCSERCKLVDLGNWATESYRVPSKPDEEDEDPPGKPAEADRPKEGTSNGSNGKPNGKPNDG